MAYDLWGESPLYENGILKEGRIPPVTPIDQVQDEGNCGRAIDRGEEACECVGKLKALKRRVKELTGRSRGISMQRRLTDLNRYVRGWIGYFGLAQQCDLFDNLDGCPVFIWATRADASGSRRAGTGNSGDVSARRFATLCVLGCL